MKINGIRVAALLIVVTFLGGGVAFAAPGPAVIRLDYATYNPVSLVLKDKGWAEADLGKDGIKVEWTLSEGSNRALAFLNSNSIDFGSTAGAAALVSRSNGNPIYGIYIYSKPEWTALVTLPGSGISRIQDLKGKKVAATIGTDPYIFLIRSLDTVGLGLSDIELVPLQHGDGANALVRKQVDAWAGLDPHMARVQVEDGATLFYRNPEFNTYGVLNVRKEFADKYPAYVDRVISLYEKAKGYARDHRPELIAILAREGQVKPEIAKIQIDQRTDLSVSTPGDAFRGTIAAAAQVLLKGGQIRPDVDVDAVIRDYIRPGFAEVALGGK